MKNKSKPTKVELVVGSACTKFLTSRDFQLHHLPLETLVAVPLEGLAAEALVDHLKQVNSFVACQNYFEANSYLGNWERLTPKWIVALERRIGSCTVNTFDASYFAWQFVALAHTVLVYIGAALGWDLVQQTSLMV